MLVLTKYPQTERQTHTCSVCGRRAQWGSSWTWWGSWRDLDDGKPVYKFCSDACRQKAAEAIIEQRKENEACQAVTALISQL